MFSSYFCKGDTKRCTPEVAQCHAPDVPTFPVLPGSEQNGTLNLAKIYGTECCCPKQFIANINCTAIYCIPLYRTLLNVFFTLHCSSLLTLQCNTIFPLGLLYAKLKHFPSFHL